MQLILWIDKAYEIINLKRRKDLKSSYFEKVEDLQDMAVKINIP